MAKKPEGTRPLMSDHLSDEDEVEPATADLKTQPNSRPRLFTVVATISLLLNAIVAFTWLYSYRVQPHKPATDKEWNTVRPWIDESPYYSRHHQSKNDQNWAALGWEIGMVAVDDSEANELGVPRSDRFPWDDAKGIYFINAYHNLHCLSWVWESFTHFRDGKPFGSRDWHSFHCLDQLRQDTICYADDTLRHTGGNQSGHSTGMNQNRQCRDWSRLEQWAKERTACYQYLNHTVKTELDRYKLCPPDSPYNEVIDEIYGVDERQRLVELYGLASD